MKLEIDPSIFTLFPELLVGVVVARNVNNQGMSEDLTARTRVEESRIRGAFTKESFVLDPALASWRSAYSVFGVKHREAKSSIENLYRLILNGRDLRSVNKLVDLYNLVSITHMMPLGGEDLDTIQGDLVLTIAGANEPPVKLLGDERAESPCPGEIFYRDDHSAVCRRWNWREADRTKLTEMTTNAVLVAEALPPKSRDDMIGVLTELEKFTFDCCGGAIRVHLLDAEHPRCSLDSDRSCR